MSMTLMPELNVRTQNYSNFYLCATNVQHFLFFFGFRNVGVIDLDCFIISNLCRPSVETTYIFREL